MKSKLLNKATIIIFIVIGVVFIIAGFVAIFIDNTPIIQLDPGTGNKDTPPSDELPSEELPPKLPPKIPPLSPYCICNAPYMDPEILCGGNVVDIVDVSTCGNGGISGAQCTGGCEIRYICADGSWDSQIGSCENFDPPELCWHEFDTILNCYA